MKAITYTKYGGLEELHLTEVENPSQKTVKSLKQYNAWEQIRQWANW